MTDSPNLWDRRPTESDKAYHALTVYLDLGAERSLEKVRQTMGKRSGYVRQLEKWSSRFEWGIRATAYDGHQRTQVEETKADLRKRLLEQELKDGELLLDKWRELIGEAKLQTERLKSDGEDVKVYVEVNIPGYIGLAKLRREIGDQMRRAIGLPEKITQSQHTGDDGGPVEFNGTQTHKVDDLKDIFREMREFERKQRDDLLAQRRAQSSE